MSTLLGQTIGNYRVEALLGSGGMGDVYRGMHVHLNRPAAIKVLHDSLAADPGFQARFRQEAQSAAALHHPNIVEVFDFGDQDGLTYLVMELVPDGSLAGLLRRRAEGEAWPLAHGLDCVRQAAEGLAYAHTQGMVHRDIKPDNLLLQRASDATGPANPYDVKIGDFGLAKLAEGTGLTVTGTVMGTPAYMSPEQCQGKPLDGRSDLYSLGVVLYQVVTGALPFDTKTLTDAVYKHVFTPPPPPREVKPDISPTLEAIILRCLAKRPSDRYATCADLALALGEAVGREPAVPVSAGVSRPLASAAGAAASSSPPGAPWDATVVRATAASPLLEPTVLAVATSPNLATPETSAARDKHETPAAPVNAAPGLTLAAEPAELPVAIGEGAAFAAVVTNGGAAADLVRLTVAGVPPGWTQGPSQEIHMAAGERMVVPFAVAVTNAAAASPGEYPLAIHARSLLHAGVGANAPARWIVAPRAYAARVAAPAAPTEVMPPTPVAVPMPAEMPHQAPARRATPPPEWGDFAAPAAPTVPFTPPRQVAAAPRERTPPPPDRRPDARVVIAAVAGVVLFAIALALVLGVGPFFHHPTVSGHTSVPKATGTSSGTEITTATVPAGEQVRFQDALTTSTGAWPTSDHCAYAAGGYQVSGAWHCYSPADPMSDGTLSVRARLNAGPTDQFFGLVLRSLDDHTYYEFAIDGGQRWTFILWSNGNPTTLVQPTTSPAITAGLNVGNELEVRAHGGHFDFYVNGTRVGQADDGTLASGRTGLKTSADNQSVIFNNFQISVPA